MRVYGVTGWKNAGKTGLMERLVADVFEGETLAAADQGITFEDAMPPGFVMRADPEQLHRVVSNLVRNARQAIAATGQGGTVRVAGREDETSWTLCVSDTGPGLPAKARDNLFRAFQGGTRKEGSGLGLAIAAELVRGHGGRLDLVRSDETGTEFAIRLPKSVGALDAAAE